MNTPIYDRLVAERAAQAATTAVFPRTYPRSYRPGAAAVVAKPNAWFDRPRAEQTAPPGLHDLSMIVARIGMAVEHPATPALVGLGGCYTDTATVDAGAGACA
jgi:hypothetical protein